VPVDSEYLRSSVEDAERRPFDRRQASISMTRDLELPAIQQHDVRERALPDATHPP
jgi:hypothetical protein